MEQFFTEDDILCAIKYAIRELNNRDALLLDIHSSERSQVHWLAIYFDKKVREIYLGKNSGQQLPEDYRVDVEYNRVGSIPNDTKQIPNLCVDCEYDLGKCKKKHTDNVTVDMIFHKRGINNIASNIFCLEVKPSHNKESVCDNMRICELVTGAEYGSKPLYQYGLALHLLERNEQRNCRDVLADGYFYTNEKYKKQISHSNEGMNCEAGNEKGKRFICTKCN